MTHRSFTVLPAGRYHFEIPEYATTFEAHRLHWENNFELKGDLTVRCAIPGAHADQGTLSWGTFTFTSTTARHTLAKRLAARAATEEINWDDLIESFCYRVRDAEQVGEPAVLLADVPDPPADDVYVVERLQLPKTVASMFFGDGDSLKSTLALYVAGTLAKTGVTVGFFDWELNKAQQKRRYRQLFGEEMPGDLVYAECTRPLIVEADRLARIVGNLHLDFAVFDSVVPACGSKPEDADQAASYFRAVRNIGGPAFTSLHIAHITKSENGDAKPFGSVFWSNLIRQSWFVKAEEPQPGEAITIGLYPRKHNLGPKGVAIGFAVSFLEDQIAIWPTDLNEIPELAGRLPLWQRMMAALKKGPQTVAYLAEALEAKPNSIEQAALRGRQTFTKVMGMDGVQRISLVERRRA